VARVVGVLDGCLEALALGLEAPVLDLGDLGEIEGRYWGGERLVEPGVWKLSPESSSELSDARAGNSKSFLRGVALKKLEMEIVGFSFFFLRIWRLRLESRRSLARYWLPRQCASAWPSWSREQCSEQ